MESNREHGEGRRDVVVYDPIEGRVAVFEAKYFHTIEDMEKDCEKALQQIDKKCMRRIMKKNMTRFSVMGSHL